MTAEPPFALCGPFARFSSSVASMTQVILSSATDDHQSALLGEERDRWRYCVYNCDVDAWLMYISRVIYIRVLYDKVMKTKINFELLIFFLQLVEWL